MPLFRRGSIPIHRRIVDADHAMVVAPLSNVDVIVEPDGIDARWR
jgi:hypothetical protein